ncbi:PIG-L family deacetylase [Candidatus Saccharibacteria bacterium]|nr:PIG-L family deacetylase [Candidatus Saccharibacteria bacterium]MBI3338478.1 PIG-L family deacetylase [Candidatus Saccharibacteria bacterium]
MSKSSKDITRLGTILSVWAHPDDETLSCAGIMMAAIANDQKVICVTATRGEAGVRDESRWPATNLGKIRSKELAAALKIMGVTDHHWLDYPDGGCDTAQEEKAAQKIAHLIEYHNPDTILTFGPEGLTGHSDHCTVSRWVDLAVRLVANSKIGVYHATELRESFEAGQEISTKHNFFFNIDRPPIVEAGECDILFRLPKELLAKKYMALQAMPSQYEDILKESEKDTMYGMIGAEAFVRHVKSVDSLI